MRRKMRQRGFTLIEILVALVVVSVGLTAALRAFGVSMTALGDARDSLTVGRLIQEYWADLEAETVRRPAAEPVSAQGRFDPPYEGFVWQRIVTPVPSDAEAAVPMPGQLYEVELRVRRTGATRGGESARTLLVAGPFSEPDSP